MFLTSAQIELQSNQDENISRVNYEKVHELRLGAVKLLAGGFLDVSYEYINTASTGLGASLYIRLDDNLYNERFGVLPYYRFYFGNNKEFMGRGFFVEAFAYAYQGKNDEFVSSTQQGTFNEGGNNFFEIAPGFALGSKWVNSSGFVFQIKGGVGRNILGTNEEFGAILIGDFYVGYRF